MSRARSNQTTSSAADERNSARQVEELAALRRMLVVSEGCFSLSFAICNDRMLRNDLIERLRAEFAGIVVVELPAKTGDVYQTVCDHVSGESPKAIFVLDVEASVPFEAKTYPTLRSLNSSRELWERLACPVVFWLAEYAAALVARQAPDFWRYRSHQFEFVSDRRTVRTAITERFPGFAMVDGLPFEEKRFRVAELEQRLQEVGEPPSFDLMPHALEWLYELAYLYRHSGHFDRARELYDRALTWTESAFGSADPRTATALDNLALLLLETNRLAEAEPLQRRALFIDEQRFGKDHPKVAIRLNNLAGLLQAMNRNTEAERLMRRSLCIGEQSFGKDNPNVATNLNNFAQLLHATSRLAEAEPLMRRALLIDEQSFGKEHPNVARDLNNLAALLRDTNRPAEAELLLRRALVIDEQSFGKNHPYVATVLNNLALLLLVTNRLTDAEPLIRRALLIDEQSFGKDHPNVARDLNNLSLLFLMTNRLAEAEPLMSRVLEIFSKFPHQAGYPNPHLETSIRSYASLLQAMGLNETQIKQRLDDMQASIH
jgi:tetratricopeptide (TPR) repeat protein